MQCGHGRPEYRMSDEGKGRGQSTSQDIKSWGCFLKFACGLCETKKQCL